MPLLAAVLALVGSTSPSTTSAPTSSIEVTAEPKAREAGVPFVGEPSAIAGASSVEPARERSTAIFIAPLTILSGAAWAPASNSKPIVFVLVGASFFAADVEWSIDLALMQRDPDNAPGPVGPLGSASIGMRGFVGGWLGVGPVFHTDRRALHGFFVSPKVTVGVFAIGGAGTITDTLVGADVGYQFTVGRVYLAFMIGASVGVGVGDNDIWAGPLTAVPFSFDPAEPRLAFGLNLQLVRAGFTF